MARGPANRPLLPSVLDRLTGGGGRGHRLSEIREGIRRDLEDLLNTRWRCSTWPDDLEELDVSLANYGLPDLSGVNLGSPESQEEFRRIIERAVRAYEPRFRSVVVRMVKNPEPMDRTLRFRIEATLLAEPLPEQLVFDSALEPLSANFEVKESLR